ncbi:hypothetical protein BKA65DRAFT_394092 [Rhexocercosporidium sp. MPI-PUGE-AT-0058]|nr:hypothetical protein BKA65DRAFT_394092 [Rhexocercosporidium sp. MPI-PUGE-AT-0058]
MERQTRRRRRPALSCLECRRRKIKCDRNEPCTNCVSTRSQCSFELYSNEPVQLTRQQSQLGNSRSPNVTSVPSVASISKPHNTPNTAVASCIRSPNRVIDDTDPDIRNILQRVRKLEEASASSPVKDLSEAGIEDSHITLNKTRMLGSSHRMGWGGEFANIWECYKEAIGEGDGTSFQSPETRPLIAEIGELLQKCKVIARSLKIDRPSRGLSTTDFTMVPPAREVANGMANLYFGSFESTHRIVHVPTFWTEYQRYWDNPAGVPIGLRLKILLVIGLGYSLHDHGNSDVGFRNLVHQWIHSATMWLSGPLEKDRLNITGLQVHCLTLLARQIFSLGGDLVWISTGSLVHTAMQIGLHRDPANLPPMSVLQAELRRRLWATVLELVMQASLDTAMPPRISLDEFDTAAPSNNNDDEMNETTMTLQPHSKGIYTTTSMQLLLLDSLPIRLRILQLLNGLHSQLSYLDVLALSTEITGAYRACSNFMKEHEAVGVSPFHRNMIYYLVCRFLIPLHCPFANKARTNPLFQYSLTVSLETAMAIISPEPDEGYSRLIAIGGGMFREGIRYAMSVIGVALLSQVEDRRRDGTLNRSFNSTSMLLQSVKDMVALSAERIRQGETNIKGHMFLSMVVAQVDAMEAGTSCEYSNAHSARDSLLFCHGLLQARAATMSGLGDANSLSASPFGEQEGYGMDFDLDFFLPNAGFS